MEGLAVLPTFDICIILVPCRQRRRLKNLPAGRGLKGLKALKIARLLLVLVDLIHSIPVDRFSLNQLLVHKVAILTDCFQPLTELHEHSFMILIHPIKLKSLSPKPVSFLLHIDQSCFLFRFDSLDTCLFLQIPHVFLHYVHFLLKCCQKVFFMLIDYAFDKHARVLDLVIKLHV